MPRSRCAKRYAASISHPYHNSSYAAASYFHNMTQRQTPPTQRQPPPTQYHNHSYEHSAPFYSENPQWQPPPTRRRHNRPAKRNQPKGSEVVKKISNVACWTDQRGTDPPRSYCSRQAWSNQRKVPRDTPLDKVGSVFRGSTVSEMSELSKSAHLEPAEDSVYCDVCGGLVLVPEVHEASLFHQAHARPKFSQEPFDALVEDMLFNPGEDSGEDDDDTEDESDEDGV